MEAPKEIWMPEVAAYMQSVKHKEESNDIKYIRADLAVEKEKLVEYLERQLNTLSWYYDSMKTVTRGGGAETYGKIIFCKRVIEKLKTL